jgi:hypothetical protein
MAVLPDKTIAGIALNAGFTGQALVIAVAVALAESGANPRAHNTNAATGDNSYGLWQINMLGSMGPERRKQFNLKNNEELFDPSTNARVAYQMYKRRGGFGDWSTYNHGTYLPKMLRAQKAVKENGGASVATGTVVPGQGDNPLIPDPIEGVYDNVNAVIGGANNLVKFITNADNWIRVGMFAGGSILVVVGVIMFIGQTKSAKAAVEIAKNVVPVGKVAKAVT